MDTNGNINRLFVPHELAVIANSETNTITYKGKEYIEKPQPKTVTLDNGTVLEVGKKYVNKGEDNCPFEIIFITEKYYYCKILGDSDEGCYKIDLNEQLIPYTEQPAEQPKEWKTFLMVVQHHKSHIPYQVIIRCKSIEDAKIIHKNAISITEVEIDIKPVNSNN